MSLRSARCCVRLLAIGVVWLVAFGGASVAEAQHDHGADGERPLDGVLDRPALQALVDHQVARDAAPLVDALDARDPDVRARAAFALASVQDTAAVPALVDRLRDAVPEVRIDAAFALGQMGDATPADALFDVLSFERDDGVQVALVGALGKTGDAASLRRLVTLGLPAARDADVARAVTRYARRGVTDSVAVRWIADRLEAPDDETRQHAAAFVAHARSADAWAFAAPQVRRALDGYAPADPAAAPLVRGLGRLADAADGPRLTDWLVNAGDWRTRVSAARALVDAQAGTRAAVREALQGRLEDPVPHVAIVAADALAASAAHWTPAETDAVATWIDAHPDRWRVAAPLLRGLAAAEAPGSPDRVLRVARRWKTERHAVAYAAALPALARLDTASARAQLLDAASAADPRVASAALEALADRWARVRTAPDATPDATSDATPDSTSDAMATRRIYFDTFAAGVRRGDVATVNAAAPPLTDSLFAPLGAAEVLAGSLASLASPDDLEAMTALMRAMRDLAVRDRAVNDRAVHDRAVRNGADTTAIAPALRTALTLDHPVLRGTAADALQAITGREVDARPRDAGPTRPIRWDSLQALGPHPRLVLETDRGRVVVELNAEQAPQTVQTVAGFARAGRYDGVPFHRVVANFVVQGGDFARKDGWGGPGFFIRSEFTRLPFVRGTIGMASAGKDTEGSQFFVTHGLQSRLDGRYTAFGTVVEGMDVVDRILEHDAIVRASVEPDAE